MFFGATIGLVACHRGFHCRPGAEGVGRAATAAFVYSFVIILALDLALNIVLDAIYLTIWPEGNKLV
jgi:phospholipid/cholesterol/gamma-HCH transport system permease protein